MSESRINEPEIRATYVAGRLIYEVNRGKYQTMFTLDELEAIIKDAKIEHPWLADRIREWLS